MGIMKAASLTLFNLGGLYTSAALYDILEKKCPNSIGTEQQLGLTKITQGLAKGIPFLGDHYNSWKGSLDSTLGDRTCDELRIGAAVSLAIPLALTLLSLYRCVKQRHAHQQSSESKKTN